MDEFWSALVDFSALLWELLRGAAAAVGPAAWQVLVDYPTVRAIVIVGAAVLFLYWFYDGIRNYRRKCIPCKGGGAFQSKLSKRLDRPCKCCNGAGRHITMRKRLYARIRTRT